MDDHRTVADAISLALASEPGMACVGTAHGARQALALAADVLPDAVVMDVRLQDGDGIEITAQLVRQYPEIRVVVLTAFVDQELLRRAADAGACALLPKDGGLEDLIDALRSAPRDGFAVHPTLLRGLVGSRQPTARPTDLTAREHEVLQLLAQGIDVAAIARSLGISLLTTRGYVKSLLAKLDAHTQLEAVVTAMRSGLIRFDDRR
ncbi:response regulator transcription factor [Intrasporangium sp.]|uniref:response regulator transcription factor n=1 Tax=Intrasporangium sp. TaxID=1925024 RepID=UPI002D7A19BA|nr:response regulator transcription factor [Intrasporangium sp.]